MSGGAINSSRSRSDDAAWQCNMLCRAPAGGAFLLAAKSYGMSQADMMKRDVVLHLAVEAVSSINENVVEHDEILAQIREHEALLCRECPKLLLPPLVSWLFTPFDRSSQEWLSPDGEPPDEQRFLARKCEATTFSRYAQKPSEGFYTSTASARTSGAIALLTNGYGDYQLDLPIVRYRIQIDANARVYEVISPDTWYALCASYPEIGEDGRLVPNWAAVAKDWDGVHLSLGGLLASEQVPVDGSAGWAELSNWDTEQTVWLHWVFSSVEPLADLYQLPQPLASYQ